MPADAKPYTVKKPDPDEQHHPVPSIDLRGARNFTLMGEGYGSVIQMVGSGGGGSWAMIHIGGGAANVTVRDLFLDGNRAGLTKLDTQTHLIRLGGSIGIAGGADNVRVLNCTLTSAYGDGVAILPIAGEGVVGEEVSNVRIAFCDLIDNNRNGISNQRSTELIQILYNYFERTKNQDIDFEPSGGTLDSGPRGYLILGNTFVHSSKGGRSVSLSGVSGDIPASNNTFAYNQIRGGGLGMIDGQYTSIVGNYIEGSSGPEATRAVVVLRGTLRGIRFANNHIVRPTGAPEGPLLVVASELHQPTFASEVAIDATTDEFTRRNHGLDTGTGPVRMTTSGTLPSGLALATNYWVIRVDDHVLKLAATRADAMNSMAIDITDVGIGIQTMTVVNFPHGVDVYDNRLHTYVAAVAGDPKKNRGVAAVTFRNAQDCSFSNNEIHSYSGVVIPNAVRFDTSPAILRTVKGWDINGNRFRGDAKADETGVFTNAILIKPMGVEVEDIRINFNNFRGCTNQICWSVGPEGTYLTVPMVMGNNGDGIPYRIDTDGVPDLDLDAILIGGNDGAHMTDNLLSGSAALYCGGGEPSFPAALGSIYMRTGGSGEGLLYVNTDGVAAWQPFA